MSGERTDGRTDGRNPPDPPPHAPTWSAPDPELQRCCCASRAPRRPPRATATTAAIARLPLERTGPAPATASQSAHAQSSPSAPGLRFLRGGSSPGRRSGVGLTLPCPTLPTGPGPPGKGWATTTTTTAGEGAGGPCCYGARGGHVPRAQPAPPASAPCSRVRAQRHMSAAMAAAGEPGAGGAAEEAFLTFYNEVPAPRRRRGGRAAPPRLTGPACPPLPAGGRPSQRWGLAGRAEPGPARPGPAAWRGARRAASPAVAGLELPQAACGREGGVGGRSRWRWWVGGERAAGVGERQVPAVRARAGESGCSPGSLPPAPPRLPPSEKLLLCVGEGTGHSASALLPRINPAGAVPSAVPGRRPALCSAAQPFVTRGGAWGPLPAGRAVPGAVCTARMCLPGPAHRRVLPVWWMLFSVNKGER